MLPRISHSLTEEYLRNQLAPVALFSFQLIVALCFVLLPFLAFGWSNRPIAIGYARPASFFTDQFVNTANVNPMAQSALMGEFWIPYLVGVIYLITSLWVFFLRRANPAARVFALFACAAALAFGGIFNHITSGSLEVLWISSVALAGAALINLALIFPEAPKYVFRYPFLPWAAYAPVSLILGLLILPLRPIGKTAADQYLSLTALVFALFGLFVFLLALIWRCWKGSSPLHRKQSRVILWGCLLSFGMGAVLSAWCLGNPTTALKSACFIPLAGFPLSIGYAFVRYPPEKKDSMLIRAAVYVILTLLAGGVYFLLLGGLSLIAGSQISSNQPILILLTVAVLAFCLNPARDWIQMKINTAFSGDGAIDQEQIQVFSQELTQKLEIKAVLHALQSVIHRSLSPVKLHTFLYDPLSNQYTAVPDADGQLSTDLHFQGSSQLISLLESRAEPIYIRSANELPVSIKPERNRLALMGATLFAKLPGQSKLVGLLALGPKGTGESYTHQEIRFLQAVSDQAALAIERLQVIENLEQRVREMDVLTRVAQGVNITPQFDDILELIYAQTNNVFAIQDFRITLANPTGEGAYHAFYLEQDERIAELENTPIPVRQGLESVIIQSQRAVLTDDYGRECRSRSIIPDQKGIYSWVGVPLNAGAHAIGAISFGSRDPEVIYSEQQLTLLQAIAEQAAGAIVKARLLAETEKRALQLATLNEVGRSLTSTLDIQPLLGQILNSACNILNCEAGSLFLVDNSTGELVFEVTAGPVAEDLVGKRLAPGTGIVGKVVEQAQPLIVNHVQDTESWYEQPDQQTGFYTRDLMAVPLMLKESPIGVIELINKGDGSNFTQEDEKLLSTLSSQAAIAIENARLYTQTDEALNARLEEMSVMQRIDRELNTSLDVDRTMRIALDWSISQSHADAGLIGFIEKDEGESPRHLRVIASHGYSWIEEKPGVGGKDWIDLQLLQAAIQDGQAHRIESSMLSVEGNDSVEHKPNQQVELSNLLDDAKSQAIIPIRRKSDVIGLLLLESVSTDCFSTETLTFLTRLSDHAAIAISNALLYADLQSANVAKSEFVSLVSHELKTPMTSIRGYTDLLAQGTVGPINEIQANFLNTIRSNVNRMANLVSDLADVSRIEAGRLHLEFRAISIEEVFNEVVRSVQAQLSEKEHSLEVNLPEDLPQVWGDLNRLIQIMNNLVSNAIKYTPRNGEISIQAELADNKWDPDGAPEVVHVSVSDNGLGISKEDQEKVFQKFFRSADQNVRDLPGTGLGLNITRHLVEMQGGRIWFESDFGRGSVFHFIIPVAVTN